MSRTLCAAASALLLATMRISAHHAVAAEYDENNRVTVCGTVTRFEWTNPHAWLYVDGKDASNKVTSWSFEMGSPNGLLRRGWRRMELKKGNQITVEANRAKGRQQCGQRRYCHHARWPEAIRGLPNPTRC